MILSLYEQMGITPRAGSSTREIEATNVRLMGVLPLGLQKWLLEANGSEDKQCSVAPTGNKCVWRFASLADIQTLENMFSGLRKIIVRKSFRSSEGIRPEDPINYAIFCDQHVYAPFYAVNIRETSAHFGEVISCLESEPDSALLTASSFERFELLISKRYEDVWLIDAEGERQKF